jgi:hypothetical protein
MYGTCNLPTVCFQLQQQNQRKPQDQLSDPVIHLEPAQKTLNKDNAIKMDISVSQPTQKFHFNLRARHDNLPFHPRGFQYYVHLPLFKHGYNNM